MTYNDYWCEFDIDSMLAVCKSVKDEPSENRVRRFLKFVSKVPPTTKKILMKVMNVIHNDEENYITLKIEVYLRYIRFIYEDKGLSNERF